MPETHAAAPRIQIALLTLAAVLVVGQTYVVIPLFTPMGEAFGVAPTRLAASVTAFGLPYAFSGLLAGPVADAWGAKRVIAGALGATALVTLAVALAPGFAGLLGLRTVQGFTAGFVAAPAFAYIAGELPERLRAFATTALQAGALASAVLMQLFGQVLATGFGWRAPFIGAAPLLLALALAAGQSLRSPSATSSRKIGAALSALPELLHQPRLLALYGAALTLLGGFVAVLAGISLYGPENLRNDPAQLFWVRAAALPVMIALPFLVLRLKAVSLRLRILAGLGVSALSLALLALVPGHAEALATGLAACVAGILIAAPAIVEGAARAAPNASGAAVSLYTFAIFLGASLGPQVATLFASLGLGALLAAIAVLFLLGGLLGAWGIAGIGSRKR
ncbi:transport integral membrane protein [Rhodovulum sulfidophilum]|uniref:Transport integral membrane protein n=1 Tax=Rhodovulum sulfidophilum TaxID=35806 RepID=A0A0D6AYM9_RHOSU|nr:transport integral membrane protein [Rhodovulum sulfidophilum]